MKNDSMVVKNTVTFTEKSLYIDVWFFDKDRVEHFRQRYDIVKETS